MKKGQKTEAWMGADLKSMAAVDNTAVAEMKWEERRSLRSSHPHGQSVGGACNETRLRIQQPKQGRTGEPLSSSTPDLPPEKKKQEQIGQEAKSEADMEKKKKNRSEKTKKKLKSTALLGFLLLLQVGAGEERKGEEVVADPPCFGLFFTAARGPTRCQWRWCLGSTRRHCSCAQKIC